MIDFPHSFKVAAAVLRRGQGEQKFTHWEPHWHPAGHPGIYARWVSKYNEPGESWADFKQDGHGEWVFGIWNTIFRSGINTNIERYQWLFKPPPMLDNNDFSLDELETAQRILQEDGA